MSVRIKLACIALLMVVAGGAAVAAEAFDPATRTAIQDVITRQLKAFAQDDAATAATFASKGIQQKFPEPAKFLDMVKTSYPALVKPKSTEFGETASSPQGTLQKMTVVAADGTIWIAIYILEKAEGGWRITGCGLTKVEGQQDI